jgi:hypothetical protein
LAGDLPHVAEEVQQPFPGSLELGFLTVEALEDLRQLASQQDFPIAVGAVRRYDLTQIPNRQASGLQRPNSVHAAYGVFRKEAVVGDAPAGRDQKPL